MVPLALLECGQDRPLWTRELGLTPAGSRRQLSWPTILQQNTTNREASRHPVQLPRPGEFTE